MNKQKYYPSKIFSVRNIIIVIITVLAWYKSSEISFLFAFFLIIYLLFNLYTYKIEKSDTDIKFYKLFKGTMGFKWTEINKVEYDKDSAGGFIWKGLFIYFFIGDTYQRFNINNFDKLLFNEIINQCSINNIPVRDTT